MAYIGIKTKQSIEGRTTFPVPDARVSCDQPDPFIPEKCRKCPLGGEYPPFMLVQGPACPNGHKLNVDRYREMRFLLKGPRDKDELLRNASDGKREIRKAAILWIMSCDLLSNKAKKKELRRLAKDSVFDVREQAMVAFVGLKPYEEADVETVRSGLADEAFGVRESAVVVLARMKGVSAINDLVSRYGREKHPQVRQCILQELAELGPTGMEKADALRRNSSKK
jgi:hypothetical protein